MAETRFFHDQFLTNTRKVADDLRLLAEMVEREAARINPETFDFRSALTLVGRIQRTVFRGLSNLNLDYLVNRCCSLAEQELMEKEQRETKPENWSK